MQLEPKKVENKISKTKSKQVTKSDLHLSWSIVSFKPISYGIYNFFDKGKLIFSAVVGMIASIFTGGFHSTCLMVQ